MTLCGVLCYTGLMKVTALIMAGGRGERFWPRSRTAKPKQFLNITDDARTMIQLTIERIAPLVQKEDIFILTNRAYADLTIEQVCENAAYGVPRENVLFEPQSRNTCPAIAFGAAHIRKKYGDALMLVLPSDSLVTDTPTFVRVLQTALDVAECARNLVTVGITPTRVETGYGYINVAAVARGEAASAARDVGCENADGVFRVARYVEKPDFETAARYVADGNYLWNSGQFIMKCSSFFAALDTYAPDIADLIYTVENAIGTERYERALDAAFSACRAISVDYAVMEKSPDLFTVAGDFGWDDVGSWNALERVKTVDENGNVASENAVLVDCTGCIMEENAGAARDVQDARGGDTKSKPKRKKLITAIGLEDVIVVDTDDVLLLCKRDQAQNIKKVLETLKAREDEEYL